MTTLTRLSLASLLLVSATLAVAQTSTTSSTPAVTVTEMDSADVRERFMQVLSNYPPSVGAVLKTDPTLFGNHDYLASYPALASFLAEHPQVVHSPDYYLEHIVIHGNVTPDPVNVRILDRTLNDMVPFAVFLVIAGIVVWLIRTVIEHRRWSRATQTQTEMFRKVFDRFGTNEELLAYLQSDAGRRIAEAVSLPVDPGHSLGAPLQRILWTVQIGIVSFMLGLGLQLVSWRVPVEVGTALSAMAIIIIFIGIGFIVSAVASNILTRRFGVMPQQALNPHE
jgi:hypothetical protein